MQAEIITIGDEILIGQIVDTNSAFIAQELNKIGVSVHQITSIQDDETHILKSLADAKERAQIIIVTGGLGPTKDDITKHTFCRFFNDKLVLNTAVLAHVEDLFQRILNRPATQVNKDQALILSKAEALHNAVGTAPGMWIADGKHIFVSLPGVPHEMKNLITTQVIPKLVTTFKRPYIVHSTLITYGIGESALAAIIADWEDNLPPFIKLAYLPNIGKVRLRMTAKGPDKTVLEEQISSEKAKLIPLIKAYIFGEEGDIPVEELVANLLTNKKLTLATAESFTGGGIANTITSIPGASAYYKGSVVSYATEAKENVLNVSKKDIKQYSVVSEQVALQMAENVKRLLNTDFAIATTGNAGPKKGDSDAEIGTVFIAIATPTQNIAHKLVLGGDRERVVNKAISAAFELLQKEIIKL